MNPFPPNNDMDDENKDFQMEQIKKKAKKSKTPIIDHFGRDLTDLAAKGSLSPVVGREKELKQLVEILTKKKKNNPLLVGEAGVGKSAIVELLAIKIANKEIDSSFFDKRIIELSLTSLVAGTKYRGMFEERLEGIMKEAKENDDVILFIDEIHMMIGAGNSQGAMDAANILKPPLARGEIKLIGATTFDEYQKTIESDKALERRFKKISVCVPTTEETTQILEQIKNTYEKFHNVNYSSEIIKKIVALSDRYVTDRNNPDKSIDLMDEVGAKIRIKNSPKIPDSIIQIRVDIAQAQFEKKKASDKQEYETAQKFKELEIELEKKMFDEQENIKRLSKSQKFIDVTFDDVALVISEQLGIPVTNLTDKEIIRLGKMHTELMNVVIGQDDAIVKLSDAIKRNRTGISNPNKPTSFIWLGKTGVGKTELVKQLSRFMFNTEESIIRFDMSEYSMKYEVSKLIGSPPGFVGYEEGGQLTEKVKNKPYSIVLFDEFEKAHPDFKNILLQILDEGSLTDAKGRKVNFKNTIIVMTSNIGTHKLSNSSKIGFDSFKSDENINVEAEVLKELKSHPTTSPEFLNRIDEIIVFKNLEKDSLKKIVDLNLNKLALRLLKDKDMKVKFSPAIKDYVLEKGYDAVYGARPMNRAITNIVEKTISDAFINQEIADGDKFTVDFKKDQPFIKK